MIWAWIDTSSAETAFVADDEFRVQRQGAPRSRPLPLAARHLVRIAVGEIRVEAAHRQQLADPVEAPPRVFLDAVHHHRLADDRADLSARVQESCTDPGR